MDYLPGLIVEVMDTEGVCAWKMQTIDLHNTLKDKHLEVDNTYHEVKYSEAVEMVVESMRKRKQKKKYEQGNTSVSKTKINTDYWMEREFEWEN